MRRERVLWALGGIYVWLLNVGKVITLFCDFLEKIEKKMCMCVFCVCVCKIERN